MKPQFALLVFVMLVATAVTAGIDSMVRAERRAQEDVDHALAITLVTCQTDRVDADTLRIYRKNIEMAMLRDTAYLSVAMANEQGCYRPALTAHTGLSVIQLWQISDQRASGLLALVAALWLALSIGLAGTKNEEIGMKNDEVKNDEVKNDETKLHFTPMQQQLMDLFLAAPDHRLLQQDICDRLWPRKPDASATLYTLIRRLKPILASRGMSIECERGRAYRLQMSDKCQTKYLDDAVAMP